MTGEHTIDGPATDEPTTGEPATDAAASRVPALLAASTVGVYLLILAGVTDALANAAAACPTWPACGPMSAAVGDPRLLVVLGHRLAAVVVAGLLAWTAAAAWRRGAPRRVRAALAASILLYPVEVWIGASTATSAGSPGLSAAHLVVAMAIFSGLLVALLWQLEAETPRDAVDATDPVAPIQETKEGMKIPAGDGDGARAPAPTGVRARAWAYFRLTKPKLWWLLCLVAFASMGLAASGLPPVRTVVGTMAGGVLAVGASGTFNHVIERDVDRRMARTADRPVATARVPVRRAVAFGVVLAVASTGVFLATTNVLAAGLGVLAVLFYTVVYTVVLKPNTTQNVVLGGAVGAFPALIGWAAVRDAVGLPAVVLGAVVFLWTPAHFYCLALVYEDDYARAGIPMLPVVRGEAVTRRHVLGYLGATMLGALALTRAAGLDWLYALVAVGVGAVFLWAVLRLYRERSDRAAFRAFMASNAYLGLLLVGVVVDAMVV